MKRKRGYKKGHKKGRMVSAEINDPASTPIYINTEDTLCLYQNDDGPYDSEMDAGPPAFVTDKNISSTEADHSNDKTIEKAGNGRFKVKLKSSRTLEPHRSYSDVQTTSDTDKSNQQAAMELNYTPIENEDSTYSDGKTSEMQNNISELLPKKAGSIKIKSSKSLGLSSENSQDRLLERPCSSPQMLGERNLVRSDDEKTTDSLLLKNLEKVGCRQPYRDPRYNEEELNASLMVIKKVMKMDAAEPFNAPVDPVSLGIPDYFEIIDTPMDFGTICHNLEHGCNYMNSEDVFKDVQFIWENCYRYNNKGDYIVDLMKRVKKNFMKYWMAAGLYLDKPSNGTTEATHIEDDITPTKDKLYYKGKQKHKRRRHGIDLHKSDCLCAVCVVRRRRKEREKNSAMTENQMKSNANFPRESKIEVSSSLNHNYNEDGTSSRDPSQETTDANADAEEVEKEEKMDTPGTGEPVKQETVDDEMETHLYTGDGREHPFCLPLDNGDQEGSSNKYFPEQELDSGFVTETCDLKEIAEAHQQDQDEGIKHGESDRRAQQHRMVRENPSMQENHSLIEICKSLFPTGVKSVWTGPRSLMRRNAPSSHDGPIHSALAAFMKQ